MSNVTESNAAEGASIMESSEVTLTPVSQIKSADDAPRILGNELLVKPSVEHLDELCSLEREIAKMHNVEEAVESIHATNSVCTSKSPSVGNNENKAADSFNPTVGSCTNDETLSNESSGNKYEVKSDPISAGETALEHEDLIAVLKGLDGAHNTVVDAELMEGVTIEGEGEYQIMEVVDDECSATEPQASSALSNTKSVVTTKTFGAAFLTSEEERALALEQMEGLKPKPKPPRRRKQDIIPIQADPVMDLVSSLEAEWTDNDDDINKEPSGTNSTKLTNSIKEEKSAPIQIVDEKSNAPQITSVVVIKPSNQNLNSIISTSVGSETRTVNTTATTDSMSNETVSTPSTIDGMIVRNTEEESHNVSSATAGFRRTRIIKRKIIWDPDAPETTFSYAKLVAGNKTKVKPEPSIPTTTITKGSTTIRPIKKDTTSNALKKTQRPVTPKDKKLDTDAKAIDKKSIIIQKISGSVGNQTAAVVNNKDSDSTNKISVDSSSTSSSPAADISPSNKRRSQTPVGNGPGGAKKKKVSELDRLMGDEGAVNMLNSLEKLESTLGVTEAKSTRPMMRSRAATICEKIPRKEFATSPVKTSPPATNQQTNKGGRRTPKSRASSSWDYVYKQKKQQNIDDSMIIRRRSNSSYSSTASLNRLSLDGPPTPTNATGSTKVHESKSASTSTTPENSSVKTSSRTPEETPTSSLQSKSAGTISKISPKSFEFAKPENKKAQRRTKSPAGTLTSDLKKPAPVANKRNVRSPANSTSDDYSEGASTSKPIASTGGPAKDKPYTSDVVVKKSSKVTQIIFSTNKAKLSYTFTTQMLNKLSDILDKLAADPDTHVTVMITNDAHFCQGVDIAELVLGSTEKRKNAVKHLAAAVKNYIKTLASYPKPIIAGVNGNVMHLGVMQLAFFDIVVAGDKCTYEAPYAKMGQMPEGFCVWNGLNKIRGSFKTKLFWLSEKVQSTEAALAGLVNKLTASNKVNEEAFNLAKRIASLSPESYRVMKKTLTRGYFDIINSSLDEEFNTIIEQWSSNAFLDNIKKYVDQGHF